MKWFQKWWTSLTLNSHCWQEQLDTAVKMRPGTAENSKKNDFSILIHSFIFRKCFILVKVMTDPESIPGSQDVMSVHYITEHAFTLESLIHSQEPDETLRHEENMPSSTQRGTQDLDGTKEHGAERYHVIKRNKTAKSSGEVYELFNKKSQRSMFQR